MKKLYKSNKNKVFSGILGGIGEYLEIDPVVVRVIFVLLTCFTGFLPGIICYAFSLFIIPKQIIPTLESNNTSEDAEIA